MHRGQRCFKLHHEHTGGSDCLPCFSHVGRTKAAVCSGSYGNAVLTIVGDENQRYAGGTCLVAKDMIDANAVLLKSGQGLVAEHIAPHPGHEGHIAAGPRGRDRLVGPLSAGRHHELAAQDRLTGPRNPVQLDDHIGIRTADDNNRFLAHDVP